MPHKIKLHDSPDFSVVHYDHLSTYIDPEKVEKEKSAKYIGEFTLKAKDGSWANTPVQIYYQKEKYKDENGEHSNYFGLYFQNNRLMITDAISAVQDVIYSGVLDEDTREVLYSAFRHDYQTHGDLMADGGREYTRTSMHPTVFFKVEGDKLVQHKEKDHD